MEVFVFSYNRGIFLDNCVESIIANVKNPRITVIDDNSDDPETRSVLSRLPAGVRVITLERVKEQDYREGGFYNNIQHAVNVLAEEDVALFIEDDMQVVRPITQIDAERFYLYFSHHPQSCQLGVHFGKHVYSNDNKEMLYQDSFSKCFFPKEGIEQYGPMYFYTNGIFHVTRLRKKGFVAGRDKNETNRFCFEKDIDKVGRYWVPFMHWLPWPYSSKYRTRTIVRRIVERKDGVGFYPYASMTDAKVSELVKFGEQGNLALADDFLNTLDPSVRSPMDYMDAMKRAPRFLRIAESGEIRFRNLCNRAFFRG